MHFTGFAIPYALTSTFVHFSASYSLHTFIFYGTKCQQQFYRNKSADGAIFFMFAITFNSLFDLKLQNTNANCKYR